jgi:dipeptidyl aminopeptidase/acylaminoacyl peptidase
MKERAAGWSRSNFFRAYVCANLFLFMLTLTAAQPPQPAPKDGSIISIAPYAFPPYAEATKGFQTYFAIPDYFSTDQYSRAASDPDWPFQILKYRSDGLTVVAYLFAPRSAAKKLPVIIYNRGSYVWGDIGQALAPELYPLAKAGFVVVAPMYRGSGGAEGKDEMGGQDLNDLMNLLHVLRSIESADTNNIFFYGVSRGCMMGWQAARDGFPVRAIATVGGFTDLAMLLDSDPQRYASFVRQLWPSFDQDRAAILERRSVVKWLDKVTAPMLIMHGQGDLAVSPAHALRLAELLAQRGATYELVIYGGDDHRIAANREDRDARALRWFKKFVQ